MLLHQSLDTSLLFLDEEQVVSQFRVQEQIQHVFLVVQDELATTQLNNREEFKVFGLSPVRADDVDEVVCQLCVPF